MNESKSPKETFNPSNPEYKRVENLPVEEQDKFTNVEGDLLRRRRQRGYLWLSQ